MSFAEYLDDMQVLAWPCTYRYMYNARHCAAVLPLLANVIGNKSACWKFFQSYNLSHNSVQHTFLLVFKLNIKLYLQLLDFEYQSPDPGDEEILRIFDMVLLNDDFPLEQKVAFSRRRVEYLEEFGSNVGR